MLETVSHILGRQFILRHQQRSRGKEPVPAAGFRQPDRLLFEIGRRKPGHMKPREIAVGEFLPVQRPHGGKNVRRHAAVILLFRKYPDRTPSPFAQPTGKLRMKIIHRKCIHTELEVGIDPADRLAKRPGICQRIFAEELIIIVQQSMSGEVIITLSDRQIGNFRLGPGLAEFCERSVVKTGAIPPIDFARVHFKVKKESGNGRTFLRQFRRHQRVELHELLPELFIAGPRSLIFAAREI